MKGLNGMLKKENAMSSSTRSLLILALLGTGMAGAIGAQGVTEFAIPTAGAGLTAITAGPDGNIWFTESLVNKIGRISPDGVITEFPIPTTDSQPIDIVASPDGNLWFTELAGNKIGRITTAGVTTEFALPGEILGPSGPGHIAAGPDGNLWFVESSTDKIGRMTTAGVLTEFPLPPSTFAFGIASGPDGNLWFTGYYSSTIGRMTTSGAVTEFTITNGQWPGEITAGSDGNLWFTEGGQIGRITPAGVITQFTNQYANAFGSIAALPDGSLWFGGLNKLLRRTTTSGNVSEVLLSAESGEPGGIAVGPDGNLWFTDPTANKIGRLALQAGGCLPDATTLCLNGGRYQVRADWQVPSQGTSGHGGAVTLTGDTGTFWFFDASSVEVFVKVLDGCSSNGHAWVFAGGLTNVAVTLTVTDTQTEATRTYTNTASTAFQPIQDTGAFATCP
jgi:streptogramin lyase